MVLLRVGEVRAAFLQERSDGFGPIIHRVLSNVCLRASLHIRLEFSACIWKELRGRGVTVSNVYEATASVSAPSARARRTPEVDSELHRTCQLVAKRVFRRVYGS